MINSVDDLINAATITEDPSQDQWREVISSVLFHAKPADLVCLDELGSRFLQMGLVNASHAWYVSFQCHRRSIADLSQLPALAPLAFLGYLTCVV